ncbi:MAG: pyridoxamine 5'-phosphate oxidase family protein [Magnetovibrionaceae bacterium]
MTDRHTITDIEALEALYGIPRASATAKEVDYVTPEYAQFIAASPFCSLATVGPEGADCSPRGDQQGFTRMKDPKTILMPDRLGNNRVDSLKNIVRDPRVGLCYLVPGSLNALRVNGKAHISTDPELLASFAVDDKPPRSVIVIHVEAVYFQCGRAIVRSDLWNPDRHHDPKGLPTPGSILAKLSEGAVGGPDYDAEWWDRAQRTMW